MKKNIKFPIGLILICILIAFCFSGCSPDSITAKTIAEKPITEESNLADTLSIGLMDTPRAETAKEIAEKPEKAPEVRLEAVKPKIEPEIQQIIKEKPKEKVKIVMTVKDEKDIKKISKLIEESSGDVKGEFKVGGVISAEIEAEKLEKISEDDSVEEIATEKEYFAFLNESIPQISIDTVAWASNYTGKGMKIAILDTGIDTEHEMFKDRTILSKSFNSEGVNDLNGHGSHCAGIAAGNGKYKGAAPDAYLLNAKVLTSKGSGTTSNIIAGINWALDPDGNSSTDDGADIISMSFGGPLTDLDGPLASAIRDAIDDGVVFVAASGNCRKGCGSFFGVTMPGSMPEVITVGAVNENNALASFSSGDTFNNYIKPDVVAPGVNIMSATKNGGYKSASGTSMSTPMVAGLIALMLEKESLTHAQIKEKLENTAIDLGASGKDNSYGSGLVNVSAIFTGEVVEINETEEVNETETNENTTVSTDSKIIEENIGKFRFLITRNVSNNVSQAVSHNKAIYALDEKRVYVEEAIFDTADKFAEYLYITVPMGSKEKTKFVQNNNTYVKYEKKLFWFTGKSLYSVKTLNISLNDTELLQFMDIYSGKTGNDVGTDFNSNIQQLKQIDKQILQQKHTQAIQRINTSGKNISFEEQWGGSTSDDAKKLTFGDSNSEYYRTQGAANWYYIETAERGILEFGIEDIDSGDDLDLYLYDYQVNYFGKSTRSGNRDEKITDTKNSDDTWKYYLKVVPYKISGPYAEANIYSSKSCTAKWLNEWDCRSWGNLYRKYQYSDCDVEWEHYVDCDDYDDPGSWYCSDGDAKKVSYNYYCDSDVDRCDYTPSTDWDYCTSAEKCSDGDCVDKECTDYSGNGGSCGYTDYITSNTYCVGDIDGNPAECEKFGNVYCWDYTDYCSSDEYCNDPWNGPAACFEYECEVDSVSWDSTSAEKDASVGITVEGDHCDSSDYVTFNVYENDCWGILEANTTSMANETNFSSQGICNDKVNTQPSKAYFSSNKAKSTWTAEYQNDATGDPEFYVYAYLQGDTDDDTRSSNKLTVSCRDRDDDGYSPTGGVCGTPTDCNDNDANIYPGAKEACNNKDDDCDSSVDEGFDLQNDNDNCGACGNSCGSTGKCVQGQCYSTQCSGYANTAGDCSTEGQYKRTNDKVYKCEDQIFWGKLLCWEEKSSLGDGNYCSDLACDWSDYDCDNSNQCSGSLVCMGNSWTCYGVECGCCNSNEHWDSGANICKKQDGESCTSNNQCFSSYCVHSICRPADPWPGDGHCDSNKGENCANSPNDCGKCNGAICVNGIECQGGYCVHNACWTSVYKKGDGYCDQNLGESQTNSPTDCYGDLNVIQITQYPTKLDQGENFQVRATIQNKGTIRDTLKLEAGLPPSSWYNLVTSSNDTFGIQSYHAITKCCPGNEYYDAVEITLDPGQSQSVTFNLKAPTIHSVDDCDSNKKSAWDDSHKLVVGLYTACGNAYVDYAAKDVTVKDKYCYKDSDCGRDDEYCNFITNTQGVCDILVCTDTCTNYDEYFCKENQQIWQCTDQDDNGCYEEEYIKSCHGNYACVDGQSTCKDISVHAKVRAEESQSYIFKQPGDFVHINLLYDRRENVQLEYDSDAFLLDTETCSANSFSITEDKNCKFKIFEDAKGDYEIGLKNGDSVKIKVIPDPDTIILTNKKQLSRRFNNDATVYSLLAKAYSTAKNQRGAVYDLEDYITGHPWEHFAFYYERAKDPFMTNNAYATQAASLAKEKCGKCSNILILGDDYVVPMHRIDYADIEKWYELWQWDDEIKYIYSNQPYIPTTTKTIIDANKIIEEQNKLIIVSPRNKYSISSEISTLKTILKDYEVTVKTVDAEDVDCSSKFTLGGGNLILIGNRENNNAIKCTPWFDDVAQTGDAFDSSITLERNVWGGDASYAFVISGDEPEIGLDAFNKILAAPEYYQNTIADKTNKAYIYELSDPPDILSIGEVWSGYVLGNCEEVSGGWSEQGSCMGSDMVAGIAPVTSVITDIRDMVQFCFIKNIKAAISNDSTTGILDEVVCVSSAGGAVAGIAVLIPEPGEGGEIVADAFAAIVKRIAKSLLQVFGGAKSTIKKLDTFFKAKVFKFTEFFKFFKVQLEWKHPIRTVENMWSGANRLIKIMADHKVVWKKITRYFDDDQIKLLKNVDEFDDIAKGTEKILGYVPSGKIDDIAPYFSKTTKMDFFKKIGELENKGIEISKNTMSRLAKGNSPDGWAEIRRASEMLADQNKKVTSIGTELYDAAGKNKITDLDIVAEIKGTQGKVFVEEVKNGVNFGLKKEIDKLAGLMNKPIKELNNKQITKGSIAIIEEEYEKWMKPNNYWIFNYAKEKGIDIISFKKVT